MTLNLLRDIPTATRPRPRAAGGIGQLGPTGLRLRRPDRPAGRAGRVRQHQPALRRTARPVPLRSPPMIPSSPTRTSSAESNGQLARRPGRQKRDLRRRHPAHAGDPGDHRTRGDRRPAAGALFVLVTRMAVVDQEALWRRAEEGEIRAAIDVFRPEPPLADASFRRSPFVQPTPHIAGDADFATGAASRPPAATRSRFSTAESHHSSYYGATRSCTLEHWNTGWPEGMI